MRTAAEIQSYIQDIFNDTSPAIQTSIQTLVPMMIGDVQRELKVPYEIANFSTVTVASQENYALPIDYRMLVDLKITSGGSDYFPIPLPNRDQWNDLRSGSSAVPSSDIPQFYFINPAPSAYEVLIYPTPSTSGNAIEINYYAIPRDYTANDFTDKSTGTVSIANGATTVTASVAVFDVFDVGRYIKFDTDGFWYRIASFTNATTIDIDRNYQGTTIVAGAYLLGTVANIPEDGNEIVARLVLQRLWEKREDFSIAGGKASYYEDRARRDLKKLRQDINEQYDSPDVPSLDRSFLPFNPNDYPTNLT